MSSLEEELTRRFLPPGSKEHEEAELMSDKFDCDDDPDVDDGDITTEESDDETDEASFGSSPHHSFRPQRISTVQADGWKIIFREQLAVNNTSQINLQLPVDEESSHEENDVQVKLRKVEKELHEANEKIRQLEGNLSTEKVKNKFLEEQNQELRDNLSREIEKNKVLDEQNQHLCRGLFKEKEEHARTQKTLELSQNSCTIYEGLYKGDKDNSDWVHIEEVLFTELHAIINSAEPFNTLNIVHGKSLCLVQIQLKFTIKDGQPKHKIVAIQLQTEGGCGCWAKQFSSVEDAFGTRKEIKVQLGIHGSPTNIMKYLIKASLGIEVYAEKNCDGNNKQDCATFSMDFNEVLKDPNRKSTITIKGGQGFEPFESSLEGFLQLLFYSRDSQPPVAALTQILAAGVHTDLELPTNQQIQENQNRSAVEMEIDAQINSPTNNPVLSQITSTVPSETVSTPLRLVGQTGAGSNSNSSGLDILGVVPVDGADAIKYSVQSPDSGFGNSPTSYILNLHSNLQNVPLDNNSANYAFEQPPDADTTLTAEQNGTDTVSATSLNANYLSITPGGPQLVITAIKKIAPDRWELEYQTSTAKNSLEASLDGTTSQEDPTDVPHSDVAEIGPSDGYTQEQEGQEIPIESLPSDSTNTSVVSNPRVQINGRNGVVPQQGGDGTTKPFVCHECGEGFAHSSARSKHKHKHKDGEGKVPCPTCNIMLSRADAVKRHLRTVHKMDKKKRRTKE